MTENCTAGIQALERIGGHEDRCTERHALINGQLDFIRNLLFGVAGTTIAGLLGVVWTIIEKHL